MGSAVSKYAIERLKEPSTWAALAVLGNLAGAHLSPEETGAVAQAGVSVAAAIAIFMREGRK